MLPNAFVSAICYGTEGGLSRYNVKYVKAVLQLLPLFVKNKRIELFIPNDLAGEKNE